MSKKQEIRRNFKEDTFDRDGYCCKFCGAGPVYEMTDSVFDAHHITDRNEMPNGGYVKDNGIPLCSEHHKLAEKYHESGGKTWVDGFHPDELYRKIGSSKEILILKSKI